MINIKSEEEIKYMREAGHLNYLTREYLKTIVKPGITTKEIDDGTHTVVVILVIDGQYDKNNC